MTHVTTTTPRARRTGSMFSAPNVADMIARIKAARDARKTIRQLSRLSKAELADIGLMPSDLSAHAFEQAADARARAMLRVYR